MTTEVTGRGATVAVVAALHLMGLLLLAVGSISGGAGLVTAAVVAYALGLRHSVDADHIAMIDNSTRKFVAEGRPSAAVGLAFSSGHSTVVLVAAGSVIVAREWVGSTLDEGSSTRYWLGLVGAAVAATYLAAIAVTNIPVLAQAWSGLRRSTPADGRVRGGMSRLLSAPLSKVRRPHHVYGFGLLFGLGFDTASSVSVLVLAVGLPAGTAPLVLLSLPLMFAAAMTLGDSVNGYLMLRMYSTAQQKRRALYDVVITAVSIAAAVAVSLLTFAGLAMDLGLRWPGLDALVSVDTDWAGAGLLALFVVIGIAAGAAARWRAVGQAADV